MFLKKYLLKTLIEKIDILTAYKKNNTIHNILDKMQKISLRTALNDQINGDRNAIRDFAAKQLKVYDEVLSKYIIRHTLGEAMMVDKIIGTDKPVYNKNSANIFSDELNELATTASKFSDITFDTYYKYDFDCRQDTFIVCARIKK